MAKSIPLSGLATRLPSTYALSHSRCPHCAMDPATAGQSIGCRPPTPPPVSADLVGFTWIRPSPLTPVPTSHQPCPFAMSPRLTSPATAGWFYLDFPGFAWISGLAPIPQPGDWDHENNTDRGAHPSQKSAFELRFVQKLDHLRHLRNPSNLWFKSSTCSPQACRMIHLDSP